jgi:CheY-like chemotaxis protein
MMPVMDGWEFRNAIRTDPRLSNIPVVVLSADRAVAQKAIAMHVDGYLAKPFELDQLLRTVARYVRRAPTAGPDAPAMPN